MRALLICVFCAAMCGQGLPTASPCALSGKVVNAQTGRPVADVKLRLEPLGAVPPPGQSAPISFITLTDDAGEFAFANIEPGAYAFTAERGGYVKYVYGARRSVPDGEPMRLAAGENRAGFEFRLAPQAVITGRVFGPDGRPGALGRVSAMTPKYVNGKRQLVSVAEASAGGSSGLGEFRMAGLPAGRYYIAVIPGAAGTPTYFPGTTDPGAAQIVEAAAGKTISDIEIHTIAPPRGFRLHARVVDRTGAGLPNASRVSIPLANGSLNGLVMNGEFIINDVPQGNATVVLSVRTPENQIDSLFVVPVNGPEDVELTLNAPVAVSGKVAVDGGPLPKGLKVSLDSFTSIASLARRADVAEDGSFALRPVSADRYFVSVTGLPPGYYVKSVRLGEEDGLEDALALTGKPDQPLVIAVSARGAAIRGTVTGAAADATVALVPQSAKQRARAEFYRSTLTDAHGKFTFASLPPGDYKLFAWEDVEDGAWTDPGFLKPIEAQGKPVTLRAGETAELALIALQ